MEAPGRIDEQLCFALYAASRAITNAYREGLAGLGLTYPQFATLLVLWEKDDLGVRELGERLHLDSGTLSPLLKRLETEGFVSRHRAADDERRVLVRITRAGLDLRAPALEVQRDVASRLNLTANEAVLLRTLSQRLTGDEPSTTTNDTTDTHQLQQGLTP
ncbi:MAG: MarR family transcriptional regulator [Propionibacteriaceae bacterium]|nr:MarR family transcriptional regulator [Propionibacteriaceae bacterium]